jgi:hypothetical protein
MTVRFSNPESPECFPFGGVFGALSVAKGQFVEIIGGVAGSTVKAKVG